MPDGFVLESQISLPYTYAVGKWYGAFLLGLSEERLVGSRCGGCGKVAVPARSACPLCSAPSEGLVDVGPTGAVVSAAGDHREGGKQWLLVRPDGADTTLLSHGHDEIGARVTAEFDPTEGSSIAALRGFRSV